MIVHILKLWKDIVAKMAFAIFAVVNMSALTSPRKQKRNDNAFTDFEAAISNGINAVMEPLEEKL